MPPPQKIIAATPEPSPSVPLTTDLEGFDFNAFDAGAAKALVQRQADIEVIRENVKTGSFYGVPHELAAANYHFVRCGLKGEPAAEEFAARRRNDGFVTAPPSVRAHGFEREGDRTLIVGCRPEVLALNLGQKVKKGRVTRERLLGSKVSEIEDKLRRSLPAGTDLHMAAKIGTVEMAGGSGLDKFEAEMRAVQRDLPRKR